MDRAAENLYDPAMDVVDTPAPPPDLLVAGHHTERQGYAVYRRRGSGNWLITYTVGGQGLYRQPGLAVRAGPGDIVLLEPGALHDYSVPADAGEGASWDFLWAHFHPRPAWLSWWRLPACGHGLYIARLRTHQARVRVEDALRTVLSDVNSTDLLAGECALNGLELALLLAVRDGGSARAVTLDARVRHALDLVTADLAAPHDVAALARAVALSPSRLAHLFRVEVGDSVTNTILTLRLRQAARLLAHTPRSIGEIAGDVGFNSPFYLSRQFRRHYGVSPRAYRAARADAVALGPR